MKGVSDVKCLGVFGGVILGLICFGVCLMLYCSWKKVNFNILTHVFGCSGFCRWLTSLHDLCAGARV